MTRALQFIFSTAALLCSSGVLADDWPQWRGPGRDGVWRESGLIERFEGPEIPIKWRVPIGGGYSGPTVAAGRVYVTDRVTEPQQVERVHCFDELTGRVLWTHTYDCPYRNVSYEAGPRASVLVDGDRAYSMGTMGDLFCFQAADGRVIWQRDLDGEYQVEMPTWGLAASPLIEGDLLILQIGGAGGACMVALDKLTGKERWRALDDRASYSAPIVIDHAGRRLLVVWTGDHVAGLDPRTGEIHWQVDFPPKRMPMGIATPVHHQNYVFVSGFFDGSLLLQLEPDRPAVREIWRRCGPNERETDSLQSIISTPILRDGHIYGVDSFGELRCLDLLTGDRVWTSLDAVPQARWATIHFVENGDRTWMFNERGELLISRLTPQGFNEISRAKLIEPTTGQLPQRGGVCWSHPAFANRCIFARNDQELVCASLAAPAGAAASGAASPDAAAALQPAPAALDQAALERRFTETLAEAVFEGSWQMTAMKPGVPQVLGEVRTDRYSISKVSKVTGDRWLIFARIQYGEHDVTIPVPVRVVWAGDTPVITLDEMALPGLGTYSARVMVYRDFYSGTWFGSSYGGVMSGRITRGAAGAAPATKQPDAPGASGAAGSESD